MSDVSIGFKERVSNLETSVFGGPNPAGVIPPSGGQTVQVVLSTADLEALQTTAKQLVAGIPGYLLVPTRLTLQYKFNTTAFTLGNADNGFRLEYAGKTTALTGTTAAAGLVDQTASTVLSVLAAAAGALAQSNCAGLGLELKLIGTTPALTLGDGSVTATLEYVPVLMS